MKILYKNKIYEIKPDTPQIYLVDKSRKIKINLNKYSFTVDFSFYEKEGIKFLFNLIKNTFKNCQMKRRKKVYSFCTIIPESTSKEKLNEIWKIFHGRNFKKYC